MSFICLNGDFFPAGQPVITAQNASFKWGDGLFETMKLQDGNILLSGFHFERLFAGLALLRINIAPAFTVEVLSAHIRKLCQQNNCEALARVRLAVFRDEVGMASYLIEALPLDPAMHEWSPDGLKVDIYPFARKPRDAFANLKSANYLPYLLAAEHARRKGWDEALVMNTDARICDSSRANIFLIKNGEFLTPSPDQGCIRGVMRRHLIEWLRQEGYTIHEQPIALADLESADEAFLTNAIAGIRWIKTFRQKEYGFALTSDIYTRLPRTI